jgi:nucleotide-binding universal stress UspA family protein
MSARTTHEKGDQVMSRTQRKPAKVLVPLDGSRFREQAIGPVARFTGADRREVVLLQVVAPVNPAPLLRDDSVARRTLETRYRKANAYLDGVRKRLGLRGVPARTLVRSGDPAAEILGCAKTEGASLIAMSTHGRSGLRRTLFGSVAEAVVRRSPLPVLMVRATGA